MTTLDDIQARFAEGWYPYLPCRGWNKILIEMHDKLVAADPDIKYIQIKEKWGELRVYVRPMVPCEEALEAIRQAVIKSRETCERCGEPGQLRTQRSWQITLCDECDTAETGDATL